VTVISASISIQVLDRKGLTVLKGAITGSRSLKYDVFERIRIPGVGTDIEGSGGEDMVY
jgi:hypothetical protein